MSLPNIESTYPTKTVTLPISKKQVKIRPFLVKEEKTMLLIKEAEDAKGVVNIVLKVLEACCLEPIDLKRLPTTDIEYLFLQLRCISKGETSDLNYMCKAIIVVPVTENGVEKEIKRECMTPVKYVIPLDKIEPRIFEGHLTKIPVDRTNFVMSMRYPTFDDLPEGDINTAMKGKSAVEMVAGMVESVIDTEKGTVFSEFTKEQMEEFLGRLTEKNLNRVLDDFLDKIPQIYYSFEFCCPSCKASQKVELKGLGDFF